ncbi:MAG: glycosyltransferase family 87 protein [Nitrososphaerota archaeon]
MNKRLLTILVASLVVRLVVAPFFGHPIDMFTWLKSGEMTAYYGINVYQVEEIPNYPWGFYTYPPIWLYWISLSSQLYQFAQNLNMFAFFVKLPIIASDILIGLVLYRFVMLLKNDVRLATKISALWLLNPLPLFISSIWGMFDSVAALFGLTSVYHMFKGRYRLSAFLLGVGTSVKIFPGLLILPMLFYIKRTQDGGFKRRALEYILYASIVPIISSIPFLYDPISYFGKLFFHFSNIGQFTYWVVLSGFVGSTSLGYISTAIFVATLILIFVKILRYETYSNEILIKGSTLTLLTFLATSMKVNVQYVTWVLPFLLICALYLNTKDYRLNLLMLNISAYAFLIGSIGLCNGYDLTYIGNLTNLDFKEINIYGAITLAAGIFGSSRIVALLFDLSKLQRINLSIMRKWTVVAIVILFLVTMATFPTPTGISVPSLPIRVGVVEGLDSAFVLKDDYGVDEFLNRYNITHIVIPFSIDFVNTYKGYDEHVHVAEYSKFRISSFSWSLRDLKCLVDEIKKRGIYVMLGVYLEPEKLSIRYGVHGYRSTWLKEHHKEVLNEFGLIEFQRRLKPDNMYVLFEQPYAEYFTSKVLTIINDLNFDGVYLLDNFRYNDKAHVESILYLLDKLSPTIKAYSKQIMLGDLDVRMEPQYVETLAKNVDHLVVKTSSWLNMFYRNTLDNTTFNDYRRYLPELLSSLPDDVKYKMLFSVDTMDIAEGWMSPAIVLQEDIEILSQFGAMGGYAIYHTNKYLPYRITLSTK